jgi:two-component system OmpR family response regulator
LRILLVEDEDRIASFVVKGLGAEGHVVDRAAGQTEALDLGLTHDYDMVLLDLMLPDGSGRDVLRAVRATKPDLPIIVISAMGEVGDKVELLDAGADDYLAKPFAFAELSARVRANARRGSRSNRVLQVGDVSLDTACRVGTHKDRQADLPAREYALLEYLMRHPGQVLSRQQILDAVWGFGFDTGSNVVDVYVGYLRRKLDVPGEPSIIETVRRAGYRART